MVKVSIPGINKGLEFEFPDITPADEEARIKVIITVKREYKDALDLPEVEELAKMEGAYAMMASILKRVDESITPEILKALPEKEQVKISNALIKKMEELAEEVDASPFPNPTPTHGTSEQKKSGETSEKA